MITNTLKTEDKFAFKLSEIASWQLNYNNSNVELPALQRGFVWKSNQIEALWDSILRGFPIGSFLLSKSEDGKLFLLDGQQRATSITLGYYNPWDNKNQKFWSLKNIPVLWMDIAPKEKTSTNKFVLRVVTQSHPWGYQRLNNNSILSVPDRRNALSIFKENPENNQVGYFGLSPLNIFPYDADLPVPLTFLIKSILENSLNWKESLVKMCKDNLPINHIKTKYFNNTNINYLDRLNEVLNRSDFEKDIICSLKKIEYLEIPSIIVKKEILLMEDEQTNEDPTLFVRLNSSGTRIAGEELIYSIYKASFPEAKALVENIGANFVAPSLVISFVSRLALSEIDEGAYPKQMDVNDFRKRIRDEKFKMKLKELIGNEIESPSKNIFSKALDLLISKNQFDIPPVLVKNIVTGSPELFLMLLQWVRINIDQLKTDESKSILAAMTALAWFGIDNMKYVREVWRSIPTIEFWNKQILSIPFLNKKNIIMYPLINPTTLREYLIQAVVMKNTLWNNLYPEFESAIFKEYEQILHSELELSDIQISKKYIWDKFMNKLFRNRSLILFAQRKYINECFEDFNQIETLEDTNTPWDWDHIYPSSWVYAKWYIHPNTKHWSNAIGNLRAMSLEENRSENNRFLPIDRLANVREQSFIKNNDWEEWSKINGIIKENDDEMIKIHLSAIVNRLCNIYDEWYFTLNIGELFSYKNEMDKKNI